MKNLVLASNNRKKIAELETFFDSMSSNIQIRSLKDIGWTADIDENGASFEENSLIKASAPASMGYIGLADDSGLAVDFLARHLLGAVFRRRRER